MKATSLAYNEAMKSLFRQATYAEITFGNTNEDAARDGTWESEDTASFSETETLDYVNYLYAAAATATLELNRWILNGSQKILSENAQKKDGYISGSVSSVNGLFGAKQVLVREFSQPYTLQGLTIVFDSRINEWPREITITYYDERGNIVNTRDINPSGSILRTELAASDVKRIEIEFSKMNPYRAARVESVVFGFDVTFTNDDIVETSQVTDVDPLSRRLPTETFSFTILNMAGNDGSGGIYDPDNPEGEYDFISANSPVSIRFGQTLENGTIEWLKADRYYLDGRPSVEHGTATFNATGKIGGMSQLFYKSKIGDKNFYEMAEEVLIDAGYTGVGVGKEPWVIHESLKNMKTFAVLPIDTHANCLQLIAHACRCKLFTDDDNVVHIEPFEVVVAGKYYGEYNDNGHEFFSSFDNVEAPEVYTDTYATLELNRWILSADSNQRMVNVDEFEDRGYISSLLSNEQGSFTENEPFKEVSFFVNEDGHLIMDSPGDMYADSFFIDKYGHLIYDGPYSEGLFLDASSGILYGFPIQVEPPYFEKTFDYPRDLQIVKLRFSDYEYDIPTSVRVEYYDNDGLIDTQEINDNTNIEVTINNPWARSCTRIVVYYLNGIPFSRARLANISFRENDFRLDFNSMYHATDSVTRIDRLSAVSVSVYNYVAEMTGGGSGLENVDEVEF